MKTIAYMVLGLLIVAFIVVGLWFANIPGGIGILIFIAILSAILMNQGDFK